MSSQPTGVKIRPKISSVWGYVIVLIIGALVSGTTIYFTAVRAGDRIIEEYRRTTTELEAADKKLRADNIGLEATNNGLKESLSNRQRIINDIDKTVGSIESGLSDSERLVQEITDAIQHIISILRN